MIFNKLTLVQLWLAAKQGITEPMATQFSDMYVHHPASLG